MNLDTTINKKIGFNSFGESLAMTMWEPDRHRHWLWHTCKLRPSQAVVIAHRLLNPLPDHWEDFADPLPPPEPQGEMQETWHVIKAAGGLLGIVGDKVGIATSRYSLGAYKPGQAVYYHPTWSVNLTPLEIKRAAGILFYWAGAMMIGYRIETKVSKSKVLAL